MEQKRNECLTTISKCTEKDIQLLMKTANVDGINKAYQTLIGTMGFLIQALTCAQKQNRPSTGAVSIGLANLMVSLQIVETYMRTHQQPMTSPSHLYEIMQTTEAIKKKQYTRAPPQRNPETLWDEVQSFYKHEMEVQIIHRFEPWRENKK